MQTNVRSEFRLHSLIAKSVASIFHGVHDPVRHELVVESPMTVDLSFCSDADTCPCPFFLLTVLADFSLSQSVHQENHTIRYLRSFMIGSREVCGQNLSDISPIERWLVLAAGEGVSAPESWGERSVVVRKRHMMTDAKHVENQACLSEVKSPTSELSTAAESVMTQENRSRFVSRFERTRGLPEVRCGKSDVTMLVHKEHMQVVNSCKAQEEIHMDQESLRHDEQVRSAK